MYIPSTNQYYYFFFQQCFFQIKRIRYLYAFALNYNNTTELKALTVTFVSCIYTYRAGFISINLIIFQFTFLKQAVEKNCLVLRSAVHVCPSQPVKLPSHPISELLSLLCVIPLPINYECKAGSYKICCIFYYLHVKGHKSSSVKSAIKQWQVLLSGFFIAYYLRWQQLLHSHCTAYHIICS